MVICSPFSALQIFSYQVRGGTAPRWIVYLCHFPFMKATILSTIAPLLMHSLSVVPTGLDTNKVISSNIQGSAREICSIPKQNCTTTLAVVRYKYCVQRGQVKLYNAQIWLPQLHVNFACFLHSWPHTYV